MELITSALGSTLITISFLHFLQYAGKLHIFVFGNTFKKCGLPHFGHLHHLELIYYQLSPFGWLKCLTRCIIKQTYVCFNIFYSKTHSFSFADFSSSSFSFFHFLPEYHYMFLRHPLSLFPSFQFSPLYSIILHHGFQCFYMCFLH